MCESNAYLIDEDGNEELVMEDVNYLRPDGGQVLLRSIFGEEKTVQAKIREMNLTSHRIVLELP
jgi:predicted RNA-binding protein